MFYILVFHELKSRITHAVNWLHKIEKTYGKLTAGRILK
jgi:hypothetical protein